MTTTRYDAQRLISRTTAVTADIDRVLSDTTMADVFERVLTNNAPAMNATVFILQGTRQADVPSSFLLYPWRMTDGVVHEDTVCSSTPHSRRDPACAEGRCWDAAPREDLPLVAKWGTGARYRDNFVRFPDLYGAPLLVSDDAEEECTIECPCPECQGIDR